MAKNLEISVLLDFYGHMLTDKQRDAAELYYNEDLSLGEIANNIGITRQGVRDFIKRGERALLDLEERLGLVKRFQELQSGLEEIAECARYLQDNMGRAGMSAENDRRLRRILTLANALEE